jgi:hypothetical protein
MIILKEVVQCHSVLFTPKEHTGFICVFLQRLRILEIVHIVLRKILFKVNLSEHASN